jgi:hypothetical protein
MGKKSLFDKVIQKLTHSKDKTPSGLSKYPLIVLGSQVGGALTHQISNKTHGGVPLLNVNMNEKTEAYHMRGLVEQKRAKGEAYYLGGKSPVQPNLSELGRVHLSPQERRCLRTVDRS